MNHQKYRIGSKQENLGYSHLQLDKPFAIINGCCFWLISDSAYADLLIANSVGTISGLIIAFGAYVILNNAVLRYMIHAKQQ